MKQKLLLLLFFTGMNYGLFAQALTLTAVQVTGTCSSNAQINATAAGGTSPYQFRLTAGAAGITYPTAWQSGTNFSGLKAGTYTVQVQDNAGTQVSRNITVTTTYVSLNLSNATSTANHCPLSPDGTVTATVSAGRTPYSYRLLQGATEIKPAQSSNRFTSVTDGSYTVEVTDACGEIRTYAITVALNDFKWMDVKAADNGFITSGYSSGTPADAFDTTKPANITDGPLLFTCDSIAFRIFNTLSYNGNDLPARTSWRRVYIKNLSSGVVVWDYTYRPSDWPGGYTSPTVRLKINTNYRFYFDDLCNDIDSADRNYNYVNTDNYSISASAQKICGGYNLIISRPSDWNTKNRYNNPFDTITIISSTLAGDTTIGKTVVENFADRTASQTLSVAGITPGNTYTVRIKNACTTYVKTILVAAPPALSTSVSVASGACKINTAFININIANYPVTPGKMIYRINSGPSSFTDVNGNTYSITYPIIDSFNYSNRLSLRNFPPGSYNIDVWDQCGTKAPSVNFTIGDADILKVSGYVTTGQQCAGASTISYNNVFSQRFSGNLVLQKKNASGVYQTLFIPGVNSSTLPAVYTFSSLADGDYRVLLLTGSGGYTAAPLPDSYCDTAFKQYITLQYKLPVIDTASGFVCTPGSSDGKVTLFGTNGVRPYQFQRVDGSGNPLTGYQADSLFTGLSRGLHNFRIKDNCGNATLYAFFLDTLKRPVITPDSICYTTGSTLTLAADSIYSAAYTWTFTPVNSPATAAGNSRVITITSLDNNKWGVYIASYLMPGCALAKSKDVVVVGCTILPVQEFSFSAQVNRNGTVSLQWKKAVLQGAYFEIERSSNGAAWQQAGVVHVAKTGVQDFSFSDNSLFEGRLFYRLKCTDVSGNIFYSAVKEVNINCTQCSVLLYPNPVKDNLFVKLPGFSKAVTVEMYNNNGQLMLKQLLQPGVNNINTTSLPGGQYTFIINDAMQSTVQRKIIIKK